MYFKEAFQQQNFQAVYHLGEMYYYGIGIQKKCDEAARVRLEYLAYDRTLSPTSYLFNSSSVYFASASTLNMLQNVVTGTTLCSLMHTTPTKPVISNMQRSDIFKPRSEDSRLGNPTLPGSLIEVHEINRKPNRL